MLHTRNQAGFHAEMLHGRRGFLMDSNNKSACQAVQELLEVVTLHLPR